MNLDRILAPTPLSRFLGDFWERRPIHVQRGDPRYYDELLPTADIEGQLFGNRNQTPASFKVYRGKDELSPLHYADGVVSPEKLLAALRQGYSIHVNFAERTFPRLASALSRLERDLEVRALSHLIISPPRSQGFLPHTDPYGVMILQLCGEKRWSSYGVRDHPPKSQGVNHHHLAQEPPLETFDVRAGDLLYLPRGTVHSAATTRTRSIHLSLSLVPPRGVDLVRLIEGAAEQQAFFQEYVPHGFGEGPEARDAYARRFKDRLIELVLGADLFDLLDRHRGAVREGASRPLAEVLDIEEVSVTTRVRLRVGIRYALRIDREAGTCRLAFERVQLEFPARWHESLEGLFAQTEFHVGALGETLPIADADRVQVARNLLHAGFLELAGVEP